MARKLIDFDLDAPHVSLKSGGDLFERSDVDRHTALLHLREHRYKRELVLRSDLIELLAAQFDGSVYRPFVEHIDRVEITGKLGPRTLLAGWLGSRLHLDRDAMHLYDARHVSILMIAEAALLLGAGLAAGAASAAVAIAPAWIGRGGSAPGAGLALLLAAVLAAGLLSAFGATRAAVRGPVLEALRAE
mgnify:CR=1 FL=1